MALALSRATRLGACRRQSRCPVGGLVPWWSRGYVGLWRGPSTPHAICCPNPASPPLKPRGPGRPDPYSTPTRMHVCNRCLQASYPLKTELHVLCTQTLLCRPRPPLPSGAHWSPLLALPDLPGALTKSVSGPILGVPLPASPPSSLLTGHDIVHGVALLAQVEGDGGKLRGGAALQEQHLQADKKGCVGGERDRCGEGKGRRSLEGDGRVSCG